MHACNDVTLTMYSTYTDREQQLASTPAESAIPLLRIYFLLKQVIYSLVLVRLPVPLVSLGISLVRPFPSATRKVAGHSGRSQRPENRALGRLPSEQGRLPLVLPLLISPVHRDALADTEAA